MRYSTVTSSIAALSLAAALGGCIRGDAGLHLSERDRAEARAYLDEQLADGYWELGAQTVRVDPSGWQFEQGWDELRVTMMIAFALLGVGLAWSLGKQPGPWRAAKIGVPLVVGGGIALLFTSLSTITIDLEARSATRHSRQLGWKSSDTRPLDGLRCQVSSNRYDTNDGGSSDFSYSILLEQEGSVSSWKLLELGDEPLAHAVCERINESLRPSVP